MGRRFEKQTRDVRTQIRSGLVRKREMNEKERQGREITAEKPCTCMGMCQDDAKRRMEVWTL